jgi:hypothetical protein
MSNPIEIDIHQTCPTCLVYYTIRIGDWVYDGDALDVPSALKLIAHNLEWGYRGDADVQYRILTEEYDNLFPVKGDNA